MAVFNKTKKELEATRQKLEAAELQVRNLEADFQAIEGALALMVLSRDGLIERVNSGLLGLLGRQREALLGQHHRALCSDVYTKSEAYIIFWRELATGHAKQGRFVYLSGSGGEVGLRSHYLPIVSEKGIVERIIVLMREPDDAPSIKGS